MIKNDNLQKLVKARNFVLKNDFQNALEILIKIKEVRLKNNVLDKLYSLRENLKSNKHDESFKTELKLEIFVLIGEIEQLFIGSLKRSRFVYIIAPAIVSLFLIVLTIVFISNKDLYGISSGIIIIIGASGLIFLSKTIFDFLNRQDNSDDDAMDGLKEEQLTNSKRTNKSNLNKSKSYIDSESLGFYSNQINIISHAFVRRIRNEIKYLNKKANMNLTIGVITTAISIAFLISMIFLTPIEELANAKGNELVKFSYTYLPRLTLVVFVELFSFYFLKLYRGNLNDIKYYHNEISDITFKILALKTALMKEENNEYLKTVVEEFLNSNHNKVLEQGQTTVELSTFKQELELHKGITEKLMGVLGHLKPSNNNKY